MRRFARYGLIWILAVALVAAGLPMAHAMPLANSSPSHAMMDHHAEMAAMTAADHAHDHDGIAMSAASDQEERGGAAAIGRCKCLNCGMCAVNCVVPLARLASPELRVVAVSYFPEFAGLAGVAVRIDPGIPIVAL
jgi:hypothetical protein